MQKDKMKEAKMHYSQLMSILAALGMSLSDFEDEMEGEKEEEGYSESEGEDMEESASEEGPKPMDKGKIAIIVAKMKNRMKGQ